MVANTVSFQDGWRMDGAGKGLMASLMAWCLRRARGEAAQLSASNGAELHRVDVPFLVKLGRGAA